MRTPLFDALLVASWLVCGDALAGELDGVRVISRVEYGERLEGFWLGQLIGNWTGLATEMARVEAPFYTDAKWGEPVDKNTWGFKPPHAETVDYFLPPADAVWGADDDTDLEYMYQHLLDVNRTSVLTGEQIRAGWLRHIYSNEDAPEKPSGERENYLWVSNETAYYLMKDRGLTPPATSEPENNPDHAMIDAQLTTELFGLLAPTRPDVALRMAHLPIRTTAKGDAEWIAEFYVVMHSLALADPEAPMKERIHAMAERAREQLPEGSYSATMYDFVKASYDGNPDRDDWERTRDAVYQRYQLNSNDGYEYQRPFDAGINFAASLVSLFYGEGDLRRTIRIGTLAGWDSDNPTATWAGLLGYMHGRAGVERAFGRDDLPDGYWIARTRRNFPDRTPGREGEDTLGGMAERGLRVIDRVVEQEMGGAFDRERGVWFIPVRE